MRERDAIVTLVCSKIGGRAPHPLRQLWIHCVSVPQSPCSSSHKPPQCPRTHWGRLRGISGVIGAQKHSESTIVSSGAGGGQPPSVLQTRVPSSFKYPSNLELQIIFKKISNVINSFASAENLRGLQKTYGNGPRKLTL